MTNKAGNAMYWDATIVTTFGNVTNSGTSKISVQHKGKKVEFAKRTKVAIDKIHADYGIATTSTVLVTPHGFIPDTPEAIKEYKKLHAHEWFNENISLEDLIQTEDNSEWEESSRISPIIEIDNDEVN
jgi:regulatory protein YycH of two-component signal transduction system YycFG